jgi:hypothetical protein
MSNGKSRHIETCAGRSIDKTVIATRIAELCGTSRSRPWRDRWRIEDLLREFDRIGFLAYKDGDKDGNGLRLVGWGQGFKDMAPAVDALETAITDGSLVHPNSPCLTWNIANAMAVTDPAGGRKLDKDQSDPASTALRRSRC